MADNSNTGLPPGATLVSGTVPQQSAQPAASGGLPPGATLVSGTVPKSSDAAAVPQQSTLSKIGSDVGDFFKGAGEGATTAMGETIQGLPWIGKKIITPESMQAEREAFRPGSAAEQTGQSVGAIAEPVLEFVLGDEALKGLALADKVGLAGQITKITAEHPYIGKLLQHGVAAARMGTVGTTEALAKGATPSEAVKTGVATGVGGEVTSTALEAAAPILKNPFRAIKAAMAPLTGSEVQPTLQNGIRGVWNDIAAKEGFQPITAKSIRDAGDELAGNFLARSKAVYHAIDEATGNRFSALESALKNVNDELRYVTTDDAEEKLNVRKTRLQMQMDQLMDDAADPTKTAKPVSMDDVKQAKSDFKRAQSLYDTNQQVRMSTEGVRTGKPGNAGEPESVNPKSLLNRFVKLQDKGRLSQAVGDDAGDLLIEHAANAKTALRNVSTNRKVAAGVATIAGADVVKHALPYLP